MRLLMRLFLSLSFLARWLGGASFPLSRAGLQFCPFRRVASRVNPYASCVHNPPSLILRVSLSAVAVAVAVGGCVWLWHLSGALACRRSLSFLSGALACRRSLSFLSGALPSSKPLGNEATKSIETTRRQEHKRSMLQSHCGTKPQSSCISSDGARGQ